MGRGLPKSDHSLVHLQVSSFFSCHKHAGWGQDEGGACPSAQAVEEAKEGQTSSSSIPLLVYISQGEAAGRAADATAASDGLALPLRGLAQAAASCSGVEHESAAQQVETRLSFTSLFLPSGINRRHNRWRQGCVFNFKCLPWSVNSLHKGWRQGCSFPSLLSMMSVQPRGEQDCGCQPGSYW